MIRCSLNLVVMLDMCRAFVKRAATSIAETIVSVSYRIQCQRQTSNDRETIHVHKCMFSKDKNKKTKQIQRIISVCIFFLLNVEIRFSRYERRFRRHKIYVSCVKRALYLNVASVCTSASSHAL